MEPPTKLTVTGTRLDAPALPLAADLATKAWIGDHYFMVDNIDFPTVGCWEVTGRYEDDELTFVVWVEKHPIPSD